MWPSFDRQNVTRLLQQLVPRLQQLDLEYPVIASRCAMSPSRAQKLAVTWEDWSESLRSQCSTTRRATTTGAVQATPISETTVASAEMSTMGDGRIRTKAQLATHDRLGPPRP
ncbi:hypothetical protein PpBr36_04310 [Pyricularia pennisetigena]|uniref:hypothetical protein n=1 Tax=Pyricularia pennisetigena TaxID=1578925 RepID=UPI00114D74B7|nr:hypothetical protein PpBr36_04310 [Pyricularia pennisetigena]TLS27689.1 hypothetical protein PpBr36_04310 [Pyricularia pennisetigena]